MNEKKNLLIAFFLAVMNFTMNQLQCVYMLFEHYIPLGWLGSPYLTFTSVFMYFVLFLTFWRFFFVTYKNTLYFKTECDKIIIRIIKIQNHQIDSVELCWIFQNSIVDMSTLYNYFFRSISRIFMAFQIHFWNINAITFFLHIFTNVNSTHSLCQVSRPQIRRLFSDFTDTI